MGHAGSVILGPHDTTPVVVVQINISNKPLLLSYSVGIHQPEPAQHFLLCVLLKGKVPMEGT